MQDHLSQNKTSNSSQLNSLRPISPQNNQEISSLMLKIQQATSGMNKTFQQSILKHEEQFIKAYKIKIYELTKLFHQLKKNVEDKFINNAVTQQLQTVIKERDYFKYQCLKLNTQYKNVLDDYKNLTEQMINVTEQMNIYRHLLENQKIKSSQIQKNAKKLSFNLAELASKTIHDANLLDRTKGGAVYSESEKEQIIKLKKEIKEKSEAIRALKAKIEQFDEFAEDRFTVQQEKKELQGVFKFCIESWKRQIMTKSRKISSNKYSSPNLRLQRPFPLSFNHLSAEQFTSLQKRELLQILFTNCQFLEFLQKLLFDKKFQVNFVETSGSAQNQKNGILISNRNKLYDLMKKKGLVNTVVNKPVKFR